MDTYKKTFFSGDALKRLFVYFCNNSLPYNTDPITENIGCMLSQPLSVILSRKGLIPFKNSPNMIFPYTHMTITQKRFLNSLIEDSFNTVTKLCDCVVVTFPHKPGQQEFIPQFDLLVCMCVAVLGDISTLEKSKQNRKIAICNIILQRVRGAVQIKHDVFVFLNTQIQCMFPEITDSFIQKQLQAACTTDEPPPTHTGKRKLQIAPH